MQNKNNNDKNDEVELIDSNPAYANIRNHEERESAVSVHDLAPRPEGNFKQSVSN